MQSNIQRSMMTKRMGPPPSTAYDPIPFNLMEEHDIVLEQPQNNNNKHISNAENDQFKLYTLNRNDSHLLLVFIHGGGLSSMSWAPCIDLLYNSSEGPTYEYCAIDLRGHGYTKTSNDSDLHINTLVDDVTRVLTQFYGMTKDVSDSKPRNVILVGHSLGGAIAIKSCPRLQKVFNVKGMVVVDIVEGTAMKNLKHTKTILAARPQTFPSLQHAIKWSVDSGMIKNQTSARISVPSQFVKNEQNQYSWRTELEKSEPYWADWFNGLSDAFLAVNIPKMLLVANTDRLDNSLLVASMQGKFQLKVLKSDHIGHFVHEDDPRQTAQTLLSFVNRFKYLN